MKKISCDLAVIGAGGAGLAGAAAAAEAGVKVHVIDREECCGGVLAQCIHNGFGLRYFNAELTGPEYAGRMEAQAKDAGVQIHLNETVGQVERHQDGTFGAFLYSPVNGVTKLEAKAMLFATGCRERTRANISVPGDRCAGVYTAGAAQKLMNINGLLPGKRAVIVGSGDIGLIMARRCRWSGIDVAAVVEIMPTPSGLPRNIAQCLRDFDIPLLLSHRCARINGTERVESADIEDMTTGKRFNIPCDLVLFSVGLIPENELLRTLGIPLSPATSGPEVDSSYQCVVPGIFAAGNSLHVHDLVDFASMEAKLAGAGAAKYITGGGNTSAAIPVGCSRTLKYAIPNRCVPGEKCGFFFRPTVTAKKAKLTASGAGNILAERSLRSVRPAEMLTFELDVPQDLQNLNFNLEVLE